MVQVHRILAMTLLGMLYFFIVDDSLSSHADNCKNTFLVLSEGSTSGINGPFGSQEKKIILTLVKKGKRFELALQS